MASNPPKVVWLHLPDRIDADVVEQLCDAIFDQAPAVELLLTQSAKAPVAFGHLGQTAQLPADTTGATLAFLDQWAPAVGIWMDGQLRPTLLRNCAAHPVPMHLVDSGTIGPALKGGLLNRLMRNSTLRHFLSVAVSTPALEKAAIRSGIGKDNVHLTGLLEPAHRCLPANSGERDHFATLLATRPIWLAAQINMVELPSILAAHAQVLRRAHRMILIVVPANLSDSDEMASILAQKDNNFARRSLGEEPSGETHLYLADTDEELGLWLRIAPVTFLGQTLEGAQDNSPHPFDAAALGSVVIHGPQTSPYALAYGRLAQARAARLAHHADDLAYALETLMAPDAAAEMAHRAWQVSTSAAQAVGHVADLVAQHMPMAERVGQ